MTCASKACRPSHRSKIVLRLVGAGNVQGPNKELSKRCFLVLDSRLDSRPIKEKEDPTSGESPNNRRRENISTKLSLRDRRTSSPLGAASRQAALYGDLGDQEAGRHRRGLLPGAAAQQVLSVRNRRKCRTLRSRSHCLLSYVCILVVLGH